MFAMLLWKEWREHRWKLAFGAVILGGFTAVGLHARLVPDAETLTAAAALGALILPILVGMGLVAGDRAEGALATLLSMPIRPTLVLLAKLIVGLLAVLVPLALAAAIAWAMATGRELSAPTILALFLPAFAAAAMMLMWVVALGAGQPTEGRAGVLGLAFLILGFVPLVLVWSRGSFQVPRDEFFATVAVMGLHPLGLQLAASARGDVPWAGVAAAQAVVAAVLLLAARFQLSRLGRAKS